MESKCDPFGLLAGSDVCNRAVLVLADKALKSGVYPQR